MQKTMVRLLIFSMAGLICFSKPAAAQDLQGGAANLSAVDARAKSDSEIVKKAATWVGVLKLNDREKEARVAAVIVLHLQSIRNWNNGHGAATVPAGINPATGNPLSDLDRQIIAISAMPGVIHDDLMSGLKTELTMAQLEIILDQYTVGKVAFTLAGYSAIVPDLTSVEADYILAQLKLAREQAVDYKSMKQISAIFEIFKTKCEQYLNNNGRNWRQLYKAYTDKVKAQKAENKRTII